MVRTCDTLGKLSQVVGSGFENDDLMNHIRNTRPTVKEEFLLDTSNSSLDSIEERLQTSLLGTKFTPFDEDNVDHKKVGKLVSNPKETINGQETTN